LLRVPPAPAPTACNVSAIAASTAGVLPHAEIVVRAPHGDLGADPMIIGSRKAAAAPLEIGKDPIPPFGAQRIEPLFKESLVIHDHCTRGSC